MIVGKITAEIIETGVKMLEIRSLPHGILT